MFSLAPTMPSQAAKSEGRGDSLDNGVEIHEL
jgi:hypothetical protein